MKLRSSILAGTVFAALVAFAAPASAQWSDGLKREFFGSCNDACLKNPRVPDAQKPRCTDYCNCVIDEGQKLFSENEYQQVERDFAARNETARVKQFQGLSQPCNVRAFSR